MAYGYWKLGIQDREAVFHLIFRKYPFQSNYVVACGLATAIEFLQDFHFSKEDLAYLTALKSPTGQRLFSKEFITYLKKLKFTCDIDAISEGTVVFPHEPLLRIKGPLLQCQLLESTLMNIINFQTLIATKAARVVQAAKGDTVLEFGMRRAQGPDGALSASRAAYIGGCDATSNVLAGKLFDIPVRGTHAHSWVTAFADETTAFEAWAEVMPHNCMLLVDTYHTLQGVKNAITAAKQLRKHGGELLAIRLDSGDLAGLSIKARKLLDEAGFTKTEIIASNSLDEYVIERCKQQGAKVSIWGVGTNLVTAYDHPALDGVYKLSALCDAEGRWHYKLKLSEEAVKISNPGIHQVRRYFADEQHIMDVMYDVHTGIPDVPETVSLESPHHVVSLSDYDAFADLLEPIFRHGKLIYKPESIHKIRERSLQQVSQFVKAHDAKLYPVMLEKKLHEIKQKLVAEVTVSNHDSH